MAEFVDRRLERGVGELEELVRVGIFTDDELKSIISKRQRLEYSVQRFQKSAEDHLKFIRYEMSLMDLIALRRKRLGYDFKFNEIEGSIGKRCRRRLLLAETKFPNEMAIWKTHVDLCKRLKWRAMAAQVYTRMLQIHSDKPQVWMDAIEFELEENGSPDNARELCLKALRWHEKEPKLWIKHLRTELRISHKVLQRAYVLDIKDAINGDDPIASGKVAVVVSRNALQSISTLSFALELHESLFRIQTVDILPDDLIRPIVEFIVDYVEQNMNGEPDYWIYRAKMYLSPVIVRKTRGSQDDLMKAVNGALEYLTAAVKESENSRNIWRCVMDFIRWLLREEDSKLADLARITRMFEKAKDAGVLELDDILLWAELLCKQKDIEEARGILKVAFESAGNASDEVLVKLINIALLAKTGDQVIWKLFETRKKQCKSIEFWKTYVDFVKSQRPDLTASAYIDGFRASQSVAESLSVPYVEYSYESGGPSKGRSALKRLRDFPCAYTEPAVEKAVELEKAAGSKADVIRRIFEDGLTVFGQTAIGLWTEYMEFEKSYKEANPMQASNIFWKAQRTLRPDLVELFLSTHTLMSGSS